MGEPWREGGNPIEDIRTFMEWSREATWLTKIEMTQATLDAMKLARSESERDQIVPGMIGFPLAAAPVYVVEDLPDGKARICWSSGVEQVIP